MTTNSEAEYDRHYIDIPHRAFDPQRDFDLYIDLENLAPGTPMTTFGDDYRSDVDSGVDIPLFITGPMMALRHIIDDVAYTPDDHFFVLLDYRLVYDPTPFEPMCHVCCLVRWLLTECQNFGQCLQRLFPERQITVFEVMREIWCRLRTQPLAFSGRHLQYAERINCLALPLSGLYTFPLDQTLSVVTMDWPTLRFCLLEWTNGITYLLREDVGDRGIKSHVSGFLFTNLLRILRIYLRYELPHMFEQSNSPLFIFEAIRTDPVKTLTAVMKLARAIYLVLTTLEGDHLAFNTPPPPGYRKEESQWYQHNLRRIVENLLTMNLEEPFYNNVNIEGLYAHHNNCAVWPHTCFCRFARFLKATL